MLPLTGGASFSLQRRLQPTALETLPERRLKPPLQAKARAT
jgi:hypothetical protein